MPAEKVINPNCTCPKIKCSRHGDCKACFHHHSRHPRHKLVYCKLDDSTQTELLMQRKSGLVKIIYEKLLKGKK